MLKRPIRYHVYCKNRSCGVYFLPVGLLQFAALRAAAHSTAQTAVCAECHCTTDHSPVLRELRWLPTRERVKVRQSLSGQAPLYLADDYRLVPDSTRRSLRSADVSTRVVPRTQQLWRQNFCSRGTPPVELSSSQAA